MDILNYSCNIPCPKCGSRHICVDPSCVLTSYPPQYRYKCLDCKHTWTECEENKISTITNWPDVEPSIPVAPLNYGWICPKCGRVYSPSTNQCFHCGEGLPSNIVYREGGLPPNIILRGTTELCSTRARDVMDNISISSNPTVSVSTNEIVNTMAKNTINEELKDSIKKSKK